MYTQFVSLFHHNVIIVGIPWNPVFFVGFLNLIGQSIKYPQQEPPNMWLNDLWYLWNNLTTDDVFVNPVVCLIHTHFFI